MNMDEIQLVLNDKATDSRIAGLGMLAISAIVFFIVGKDGWPVLMFSGLGLLIFLWISDLAIIASRPEQTLRLEYRSVMKTSVKEIPFAEISIIDVEQIKRRRRRRTYTFYRIVVTLKDGKVIPFRSYYSSVSSEKEQQVNALRAFITQSQPYWVGFAE